jgi:hypothetical protein
MIIPNKFNGYSADNRRLYYDPATIAVMASQLASAGTAAAAGTTAAATAAAAAPTLAAAAAPTLATAAIPAATTAAANLGTTAALEASKQGIIQAGAQQAGAEAAKQAGVEAAKQGILQGNTAAQQQVLDAFSKGTSDLSQFQQFVPEASNATSQLVPQATQNAYQVGSNTMPSVATKPVTPTPDQTFANIYGNNTPGLQQPSLTETLNIPKNVVNEASLKMPGMPELTTAKAPPNALERGFNAATQFAKDHPYITTGGIMAAQSMMQPSYNQPAKKKYSGSGSGSTGDFKYTEPSAGEYTPIFEPTPYYAVGGPVEEMSARNAVGGNMMYPQSQMDTPMYSNPMMSHPMPNNVIQSGIDAPVSRYTGESRFAEGGDVTTGSGSIDLRVPINFGGPGIGGNAANGYSTAGSGNAQNSSLSTATGAPSQTAQQPTDTPGYTPAPLQQIEASAAAAGPTTPQGRAFVPKVQWRAMGPIGFTGGLMGRGSGGFSVGDQAADDWVRSQARSKNISLMANNKSQIQDLYTQYYRGYASGGKVSAFERMMKEEEARKKQADAQARADLEEGKSIASRTRPYSRTQTTNSPYAAAIKEFQALNKKYGIPTVAPAKTNVDLMGDQDQIEYAANGGIMHGLGGYSDGGRLLKGPGDGVSDSIPAVIGNKQPARLADGEFVVPARIVSELGNGSTEAGARKLYAMMERVQKRRGKTVGKGKVAVNSKADKHLPA